MGLIIKNGNIITSQNEYVADILVEGEKIVAIGKALGSKGHEVVDVTGKFAFPGGVDEHLHYNSFNSLGYETSHAALVGGTTTVGNFVVQPQGAKYVCNAPLRPQSDVDFMWEAINKGWLKSDSSDHCAIMGGFAEGKQVMSKPYAYCYDKFKKER